MLSSGLGVVGFSWASSPVCTELETIVIDWLGKMSGLPKTLLPFEETLEPQVDESIPSPSDKTNQDNNDNELADGTSQTTANAEEFRPHCGGGVILVRIRLKLVQRNK